MFVEQPWLHRVCTLLCYANIRKNSHQKINYPVLFYPILEGRNIFLLFLFLLLLIPKYCVKFSANLVNRKGFFIILWYYNHYFPPANEADLRIIAITNHFPLIYERFVLKWLLEYVEDKLDQFGERKGHSVAHYLIEVQIAMLYDQDLNKPLATLFTAIDIKMGSI